MNAGITFRGGTQVPVLGQGTWNMGDSASDRAAEIEALRTGIELGMTVIDTAEMYGDGRSEILVGEAISGWRDKIFLISKVLPFHASREKMQRACENSLKRLNTDYLDLYLLHWKGRIPWKETVKGMLALQQAGKIRYWGVSNLDVRDMQQIYAVEGGASCAANEVLYNLTRRGIEFDLLPWCRKQQLPVIAYSPIEQGRLLQQPAVMKIAAEHSVTPAQVALAWVLRKPGVLAIPKAATAEHVRQNYESLSLQLTPENWKELDRAFPPPVRKQPLEML